MGYDFIKGGMKALWDGIKYPFIGFFSVSLISALMGWGMDDSDKSAWNRSNMKVLTDHKTGVQYLSDSRGGMVKRESRKESK